MMNVRNIKADFRPAFDDDILSWSSGTVKSPMTSSTRWQEKKGTLEDESIFGPIESYRCFCGNVLGEQLDGVFCPNCWSIIENTDARKRRMAKIDLQTAMLHPFEELATDLWYIPVLPSAVREQHDALDSLYDCIVRDCNSRDKVKGAFDEIIALIWPTFDAASDDESKVLLGRGMALTPRRGTGREVTVHGVAGF